MILCDNKKKIRKNQPTIGIKHSNSISIEFRFFCVSTSVKNVANFLSETAFRVRKKWNINWTIYFSPAVTENYSQSMNKLGLTVNKLILNINLTSFNLTFLAVKNGGIYLQTSISFFEFPKKFSNSWIHLYEIFLCCISVFRNEEIATQYNLL